MRASSFRTILAAALVFAACLGTAFAHPHVLVTGRSEVMFGKEGAVAGVRHSWTFDEMFSTYATQGLDKNGDGKLSREELAELADVNVQSLKEFDYFTAGKSGDTKFEFGAPENYWLEHKDNLLTLHFTLPVKNGAVKKGVAFDVFDPTYFVAFSLAEDKPATLSGAPANCSVEVKRPAPVGAQTPLSESFFNSLTAASEFGSQFANRIIVTCP